MIRNVTNDDFDSVYPLFEHLWPNKKLSRVELNKVFSKGVVNKVIGVASMLSRDKLIELGVADTVQDFSDMRHLLNIIGLQR